MASSGGGRQHTERRNWGRLPYGSLLSFSARTGQSASGPISVFPEGAVNDRFPRFEDIA
jgi:hypothetical protein